MIPDIVEIKRLCASGQWIAKVENGKILLHDTVAGETVCIGKTEAEPVRHGEWVGTDFDGYADGNPVYYLWQCSCCHEEYERDGLPPWYDYCPNCGAKMDGGAAE